MVKYLFLTNLEAKYKIKVLEDSVAGGRSLPDLQAAGFDAHMLEKEGSGFLSSFNKGINAIVGVPSS